MGYCKCIEPKKKLNAAYGKSFTVCAKSLGGCGEEVGAADFSSVEYGIRPVETDTKDVYHQSCVRSEIVKLTSEEFYIFLARHAAEEKWLDNYSNDFCDMVFSKDFPLSYLEFAFSWASTKEGYAYWRDLQSEWVK